MFDLAKSSIKTIFSMKWSNATELTLVLLLMMKNSINLNWIWVCAGAKLVAAVQACGWIFNRIYNLVRFNNCACVWFAPTTQTCWRHTSKTLCWSAFIRLSSLKFELGPRLASTSGAQLNWGLKLLTKLQKKDPPHLKRHIWNFIHSTRWIVCC